jgi:histidinol-phosphate aminotransferase
MAELYLRADLAQLPTYRQGSGPQPGDTATFKLSSNENPFDPLPSVQARVAAALAGFNRYPDNTGGALVERISARYGVERAEVALGAGSVEVISQLIRATAGAGDEVVFPWRSFEAYPLLTIAAGARPVMVPLTPQFRHDFAAMHAAVTDRTRLVIVCNPNNPTGTSVAARELEEFLRSVPPRIAVVIDEAYLQFNRDPDAAVGRELFGRYPNVVVAHTFSKAYGLAGLRLGYALAPEPVVSAMRKVSLPFAVTDLAQVAGIASLEAEAELAERVEEIVTERERVTRELARLGVSVPPSQGNFLWIPAGAGAEEAVGVFARHGVVVRPVPGEGLRVSIGAAAANQALLAAASELAGRDMTADAR